MNINELIQNKVTNLNNHKYFSAIESSPSKGAGYLCFGMQPIKV